ncbi:MAG TPA: aconitase family protein, partial [Burkholderiaceae bacterium]|nr:aconitase family protein [Burkholderiaceae bacterium]
FGLTRRRLAGEFSPPLPQRRPRPMTLAEKIIARHVVRPDGGTGVAAVAPGDAVFVRTDWRFSYDYTTPLAVAMLRRHLGEPAQLRDPATIVCFRDHLTFIEQTMSEERRRAGLLDAALALGAEQQAFCERHGIRLHGALPDRVGSEGICHSIMSETYVAPGQLVVGTDSHTPHSGALGAFAFGVGSTEIANAWVTGDVRLTVPPTWVVRLRGRLRGGVAAKDLMLHLLALPEIRSGRAIGCVIEYRGEAIAAMDSDERATLTNMVAEIGGYTGIVAPDDETRRFIRERRGVDVGIDDWLQSDADAEIAFSIDVDCGAIEPMLAQPGDPGNGIAVSALPEPVRIDIAYGGSCTAGKREDWLRYHEVLAWGLAHGLRIAPGVALYLQFGSRAVRDWCEAQGMLQAMRDAGAQLVEPGCGACINAGPGASKSADQVTVSAINRNFPGRSGPGSVWLASPATVAASALAGRIVSFEQLQASVAQRQA